MTRGRFITLEGGEGVGKSTQLKALADALRARGLDVVTTREPGGSPGAEKIRELLLQGEIDRWTPETEALLFAAARSDHVARTIRPALDHGQWVLCDRFVDSSLAYQGARGRSESRRSERFTRSEARACFPTGLSCSISTDSTPASECSPGIAVNPTG